MNITRSLVVQLARLGDLVQTKRLVLSLSGPQREVHLAVDASLAELARLLYPMAVVHAIRAHRSGERTPEDQAGLLAANARVFASLASTPFNAVYTLNSSGLNLALTRLFDPAVVRGQVCQQGQHLRDQLTELAFRWTARRDLAGINLADYWAFLAPEPVAPEQVNPPAQGRGGGLGVVLAGRHARRSLPPQVLAPAVHALWSRLGQGSIVLLGSAGERAAGKELASLLPPRVGAQVVNLAGRTPWADLLQVLSGLDMLLTPDTGLMHLAAHLGVPVTAVFLSSAFAWETGPYGLGHTVWQALPPVSPSCLPCREGDPCAHHLACGAPFASRPFLAALAGGRTDAPGLVALTSRLDALGVEYVAVAGQDPWAPSRNAFRAFLARHLGLAGAVHGPLAAEVAQWLYLERDWMTVPRGPRPQLECEQ